MSGEILSIVVIQLSGYYSNIHDMQIENHKFNEKIKQV